MKIAHACNWFHLEQSQQLTDALVSVERDLMAEVNQKGLIACALEPRAFGCGSEHARKVYRLTVRGLTQKAPPYGGKRGGAVYRVSVRLIFVV